MLSNDGMKEKRSYIFVDDGYPDSADFDTNYIEYDPEPTLDSRKQTRERSDSIWINETGHIGFQRRRHILRSCQNA